MDWTTVLNQVIDALIPILVTILTAVFSYLGTKLKAAYELKANRETEKANNEIAKQVVSDVVQFVQQVYEDLEGNEKLQKAIEQASEILTSKGITITDTEINMLIESAVYGLKQGTSSTTEETSTEETSSTEEK